MSTRMRYAMAASNDADQCHVALAGARPASSLGGAAVGDVEILDLRRRRSSAREAIQLQEVIDARLRGEDRPTIPPDAVERDIAAVPRVERIAGAIHEKD